jgi:MFS family permease
MHNVKLTRPQKEAVGLLSIGTFLEYFDLLLYVHLAVLLNEVFFPQNDPLMSKLTLAAAFCSSYLMRPFGGFVIGWIGDKFGRKIVIIVTTTIMAISCIVMASIGTYAEIGLTASVVMLLCRMMQGFSSLGEIAAAQLYLSEILKQPSKYVYNGIIDMSAMFGGVVALAVASFALSTNFNWRLAFWFGAAIAIIGMIARTRLRETPEFISYSSQLKKTAQKVNVNGNNVIHQEKVKKTELVVILAYFLIRLVVSCFFYVFYVYMGTFMKESLKMTSEEIINHNTKLFIFMTLGVLIFMQLVKRYHPIKISRTLATIFACLIPFIPWWMGNVSGMASLFCLQFTMLFLAFYSIGMEMTCYKHLPVNRRFTFLATTLGVVSAFASVLVSFGLALLSEHFGHYALWFLYVPIIIGFLWATGYIKKLEIKKGLYLNYPDQLLPAKSQQ